MCSETYIFLIQPLSFSNDVYTQCLHKLYNCEKKLRNIGYMNPKISPYQNPTDYIYSAFEDGPQSLHIAFLLKQIEYDFETFFFKELATSEEFSHISKLDIDVEKSFMNIYIVDESLFTFSLQICIKNDFENASNTIYKDIILGFRSMLNSESGICKIIESVAIEKTFETLTELEVNLHKEDVYVPSHTAHVFFSSLCSYNKEKSSMINEVHCLEEKKEFTLYNLPETSKDYFLRYGWSYTSLYSVTPYELQMCLQLTIHLSARWFFWRHFNSNSYRNLKKISLNTPDVDTLNASLDEHNNLVAVARILTAKDFQFISTLKPWQEAIYMATQKYWKIPQLCSETLKTFDTVKDVIERKMEQCSQKIQRRQSSILFLIALIQTFAIIGYLNDYLNVISIDILPRELHFFDNELFNDITIFIPVILLIVFIFIMLYIADYKIRFGKRWKNK